MKQKSIIVSIVSFSLLLFSYISVKAQIIDTTSISFEDKNGEHAIYDNMHFSSVHINSSEKSISLKFLKLGSKEHFFWGFEAKAKANNDAAKIFNGCKVSPGASIGVNIGSREILHAKENSFLNNSWFNLHLGLIENSYKYFNSDTTFDQQITDHSFLSQDISASYNIPISIYKKGNFNSGIAGIFGLSVGSKKSCNYNDLDEIEINEIKTIIDTSGTIAREYSSKITAAQGLYEEYEVISVNADLFWYPVNTYSQNRIGFYHFYRYKSISGKSKSSAGTGVYLLSKDDPTKGLFGVILQEDNLSNIKSSSDFSKNFSISFVINLNFGK